MNNHQGFFFFLKPLAYENQDLYVCCMFLKLTFLNMGVEPFRFSFHLLIVTGCGYKAAKRLFSK